MSSSTSAPSGPSSAGPSGPSISPTLPSNPSPEAARQIAEARAALEASLHNIGSSMDASYRMRAQNLHANSAALQLQEHSLLKETAKFRKDNDKLKKLATEGAKKVKELGNVQNWAEMLERDFLVLQETLRLVDESLESDWETESEGSGMGSGSGSLSGREDGYGSEEEEDEAERVMRGGEVRNWETDAEGDVEIDGVDHAHIEKGKEKVKEGLDNVEETAGSTTTERASDVRPSSTMEPTSASAIT